jgi:iron complex outermembrane recepter protein
VGTFQHALCSASALALATMALHAPAYAQQAPDQDAGTQATDTPIEDTSAPEDIIVTGLRQSLASAQSIKQNSEQLVDSITAQDIGRLPDANVAEALQRISGIQIQRNRGEGSSIAIRGLTQVRTELNGRDIFSANGGRGLSFEEVGPDLLAGVDVYKNPSAELIEGSLGGTVNLRTRMPFDSAGRVFSVTGSVTRYDLIKDTGAGLSGLISDRWTTGIGEIGLLANASWQKTAFREDAVQIEPYYYHGPTAVPGAEVQNTLVPGYEDQNVQVPHGGGFNIGAGQRKRFSAAAALQWKPADNLEIYSQFLTAHYRFHDYGLSFFATGNPLTPTPGSTYTVEDGVATSGQLQNPNGSGVTYGNNRKTLTNDFSIGTKWSATDRLHVSVDYQHIHSTAEQQSINLTLGTLNPSQSLPGLGSNWNLQFDTRGDIPSLLATDSNYLSDPANYGFQAILPYAEKNRANADAIRADLEWDFDDGSVLRKVSVGGRYSVKSAVNRNTTYGTWTAIGSTCANWSSAAGCHLASDSPEFVEYNPYQSSLLRGRAAGTVFSPVLEWRLSSARDPEQAFADVAAISGQEIGFRSFDDPNAINSTVDEKDISSYLRLGFGSTVFGMDWDGNAGVRYVRTIEEGHGFQVLTYRVPGSQPVTNPDGSVTAPATITEREAYDGGRSYTKWLPSLNLRLHVTPELQTRFAFSKNIYRPDFSQLNPGFTLSPTYSGTESTPTVVDTNRPYDPVTNPYAGTGSIAGNPDLKPQRVTSFDASVEWYFSKVGFVYATVFKKNLRDLIDNRTFATTRDIPGLGTVQFNVTSIVNVEKGSVKGFEIGGQRFFDFLPGFLSGLGVQANYTLADSNAGVIAQGSAGSTDMVQVPLVGLSKHSYNLVALYDKYGLNLRLAYNWRGEYLVTTTGVGTQTLPEFARPYGVLDASASYDINRNISVTIDAANINDAAYRSYLGNPANLRDYKLNDRRISGRVRVRF